MSSLQNVINLVLDIYSTFTLCHARQTSAELLQILSSQAQWNTEVIGQYLYL